MVAPRKCSLSRARKEAGILRQLLQVGARRRLIELYAIEEKIKGVQKEKARRKKGPATR
jgi:hypothetical protein